MNDPDLSPLSDDDVQAFYDRANTLQVLEDTLRLYGDWAPVYDATIDRFGPYVAPSIAARALAAHLPDHAAPVLDVGCGTGLVGLALHAAGFRRITGLDVSPAMLEEARAKHVYERLIAADLRAALPVPAGSFAAAVCAGVFTPGHVGAEALVHVLNALTPHGVFICDIEHDHWQLGGFAELTGTLERAGDITIIHRSPGRFYDWAEPGDHGWHLVIRKNAHTG